MSSDVPRREIARAPAASGHERTAETLRTQRYLASDPSFWDAIRPSWRLDARHGISPPPCVPWSVVKRHAVPKVATAGIDPAKVDWVWVSEALSHDKDPTLLADTAIEEQDNRAVCAPRN
jgi:hypothetical protein